VSACCSRIGSPDHDVEQRLADVQEPEAEVAHQPLEARAGAEVDAARAHVDRSVAGGLHDVRVDMRAVRVCQIADTLQIVLEAVVPGDERHGDEPGVLVDGPLEVGGVDAPVARLDETDVEAALLQLAVQNQRALEVERVGHDVAGRLRAFAASAGQGGREAETVDDQVLAAAGAFDQADLVRRGVDQGRELRAHLDRQIVAAPPLAAEGARLDVARHRSGAGDRDRVDERAVQIGLPGGDREVAAVRERAAGGLKRSGSGELRGAGEQFSTCEAHGVSVYLSPGPVDPVHPRYFRDRPAHRQAGGVVRVLPHPNRRG
jgi:hypothetical protein